MAAMLCPECKPERSQLADLVQLIIKRKDLNLTEFGLVDAQAVKRQRLEPNTKVPVSLDMWVMCLVRSCALRSTDVFS